MRQVRQRRFLSVIAAVESAREAHPELGQALNAHRLSQVFAREGIAVLRRPIASRAYVQGGDGAFVIVLSSELQGRHSTRVLAHEYGHIRLHMGDAGEIVTQLAPCRRGDPREYEAELFALLLRMGPTATPDDPDVARLVAKLEAPAYRARTPEQLPLIEVPERVTHVKAVKAVLPPLPQRAKPENKPVTTPPPTAPAFDDGRAYERRLVQRGAKHGVSASPSTWLTSRRRIR